jgi:hypothetical protein
MRGEISIGFLPFNQGACQKGVFPISDSDGGGGVEDIHIILVARVSITHPNIVGVLPLQPRPTKPKFHSKFFGAKDSKTTKLLRLAHRVPIDLTLGTDSSVFGGSKEGSLDLIDVFDSFRGDVKRSEMVNGLRCVDGFNQSDAAGYGNKFAIPSWKLPNTFILKVLKVQPTQAMN